MNYQLAPARFVTCCAVYFRRLRIAITVAATAPNASNSSMPGSDTGFGPITLPAYALVEAIMTKTVPINDATFIHASDKKFNSQLRFLPRGTGSQHREAAAAIPALAKSTN
jgi:hypothetical protein